MTDEEILASTELLFPAKGRVVIDSRDDRWVYYRLWRDTPDSDHPWTSWERRAPANFIAAVRRAWGE